ncbi:MAG: redoxin domain-containing protein [Cephaloticoccus sp.]|nr:redoxin domain-containing protein [Cephaloticoccus sp.]MCF7760032.1 redoxin domain-containing protein [Cephaloticoccus sp.]
MKLHQSFGLLSFATAIFCASHLAAQPVVVGQMAPAFTLTDIDGHTHNLTDFRGKIVVLEWVNPECPFVRKHYESGNIPRLQKEAVEDGVIWLTINSGHDGAQGDFSLLQVKSWQKTTGSEPSSYFRDPDGVVGRLYDAKTTPHMFVINQAGVLVYNGAIDSIRSANQADIPKAENYVKNALLALKFGTVVKTAVTRPYGCSVKY